MTRNEQQSVKIETGRNRKQTRKEKDKLIDLTDSDSEEGNYSGKELEVRQHVIGEVKVNIEGEDNNNLKVLLRCMVKKRGNKERT